MESEPIERHPEGGANKKPRREITVTYRENSEIIRIEKVNDLFNDIRNYNNRFSIAPQLENIIFSRIEPEGEKNVPAGTNISENEYQKLSAFTLRTSHEDTSTKLGLALEPVLGKNQAIFHEGKIAEIGEMRVNISDHSVFLSFLHVLKPEDIHERELGLNLAFVSLVLSRQVTDNYNLDHPSNEALQFLASLETIVEEYRRLGLHDSAEFIDIYSLHSRQGDLREYVLAYQSGLFKEPGKDFGPADWQKDTTEDQLVKRWSKALTILYSVESNPKAKDIFTQLLGHLQKCAKSAQENLRTLEYIPEVEKRKLAIVLEDAIEHLKDYED